MSIADELAKLEELRRQRVISSEEFVIAKKKVLSDDDDGDKHDPQNDIGPPEDLSALDQTARKPDSVGSVEVDRFSINCEVGDALDDLAERELEADHQRDNSDPRGRSKSQRDDRDLLAEIYSLDRQWDLQRENYKVTGQHGHQYTPTKGNSVLMGVVVVVFGTFWMAVTSSISGGIGGNGFSLFPLFGLFIICVGIVASILSYKKAEKYERAQRRYRQRRRDLENKRR